MTGGTAASRVQIRWPSSVGRSVRVSTRQVRITTPERLRSRSQVKAAGAFLLVFVVVCHFSIVLKRYAHARAREDLTTSFLPIATANKKFTEKKNT